MNSNPTNDNSYASVPYTHDIIFDFAFNVIFIFYSYADKSIWSRRSLPSRPQSWSQKTHTASSVGCLQRTTVHELEVNHPLHFITSCKKGFAADNFIRQVINQFLHEIFVAYSFYV